MALQAGLENKRQVYLVIALFSVVLVGGGWEIYSSFIAAPTARPVAPPPAVTLHSAYAAKPLGALAGPAAQKLSNAGIDPALHFEKLALSEQVEYTGAGRNIFSAESAPAIKMEEPVKSARANEAAALASAAPKAAPKAPPIDLKYFGFTQSKDKTVVGYFVHGDDVFAAKKGDIVDHRYRVDSILSASAQVTDMAYNNTQTLAMAAN
jgi:hypothetical protein